MRIYISGPMRKRPEFNFPAFLAAAGYLRERFPEAELFSPAQKDIDNGFDPTGLTGHEDLKYDLGFDLREALAMDMAWIACQATAIYMLEGWADSSGARAEKALAEALGLEVMYQGGAYHERTPDFEAGHDAGWGDGHEAGWSDGYEEGRMEAEFECEAL